jgi:hypothetical protein
MPSALRSAGFTQVTSRVECVQGNEVRDARSVARDLTELVDILESMAAPRLGEPASVCRDAVARWLDHVGADSRGQHAWLVPIFATRGHAPAAR